MIYLIASLLILNTALRIHTAIERRNYTRCVTAKFAEAMTWATENQP